VLFREVVRKSDFGIDLHTAGAERTNYPQIRADLANPRVAELARAFGCPVIVAGPGPEHSLRRTAVAAGIPTVVFEAGSPLRLERPFIEAGVAGVRNVLRALGMIPGEPFAPPLLLTVLRTHWIRSKVGGIIDIQAELGQPLRRLAPISVHTNPFGGDRSVLKTPYAGVVLGLTQIPLVHPGDAICHLARLERREMAAWDAHWQRGQVRIGR
nr:succinylglutamate desuccinylase/aspartoacylase family protein [Acidobacteriota bacterium]